MSRKRRTLEEVIQKSYPVPIMKLLFTIAILAILAISFPERPERAVYAATCAPTGADELGPFYKPDAPLRPSVGKGYVLQGVVRSSRDCGLVPGAVIELWLAGPDGGYDDAHRATIVADASAAYRFESNVPPSYYGRPPHIHLRVSAKGYKTLITQQYPSDGTVNDVFNIVLIPAH